MKYLIIGLGNPGVEYKNTRHNIGFKVLDRIASLSDISFKSNRYAKIASLKFKGRTLILIKPNTFMNMSGKAVSFWMKKERIPLGNILIITDDTSLPFQTVRMRSKGSDGGHNGLKDIINILGETQFSRIRFGIGSEFSKGNQSNYVLDNWTEEEEKLIEEKLEFVVKMIQSFTTMGINRTMNDFNRR